MIDVKIRGEFLQVGGAFINPRHIISVEKEMWNNTRGDEHFIVKLYCVHRNSYTASHHSESDREATFERIGSALELMGGQQDAPKWEPGNVEEAASDLAGEIEAATRRLKASAAGKIKCMNCGQVGDLFLPKPLKE